MWATGKIAVAAALAGLLAACQTAETPGLSNIPASDARGIAQARCAQCHAILAEGLSPNTEAPAFAQVANRRGLTRATLTNWLRNAHNYPDEMQFNLSDEEVGALSGYILSLQPDEYRRPM